MHELTLSFGELALCVYSKLPTFVVAYHSPEIDSHLSVVMAQ